MARISARELSIVQGPGPDPSLWDALAQLRTGLELAFLHGAVFWPDLVQIDDFVLIAENYDPEYFARSLRVGGPGGLEVTINTTYLDSVLGPAAAPRTVVYAVGR